MITLISYSCYLVSLFLTEIIKDRISSKIRDTFGTFYLNTWSTSRIFPVKVYVLKLIQSLMI